MIFIRIAKQPEMVITSKPPVYFYRTVNYRDNVNNFQTDENEKHAEK